MSAAFGQKAHVNETGPGIGGSLLDGGADEAHGFLNVAV
jgi:hypothetical protein